MRAAVIGAAGQLQIEHVDDPVPGDGEVVLEVGACGICGSDFKVVEYMAPGYVMGHEFAGRVVAVGGGVERLDVGERVAALPIVGCGQCDRCLLGEPGHCRQGADLVGVGGRSGAYAQYVRVDGREALRLGADTSDEQGALVEPLAVGLHALDIARLHAGDRVLVIGGGPVGVACAVAARTLGAGEVVVSEPLAARRALVERAASVATIDPRDVDVAAEFERLAGGAADVVVEAVGAVGMLQHAVDLSALGGRIVVAGVCTAPDPVVPFTALVKELTIAFAIYYRRRDFAASLAMLERSDGGLTEMITARVDLDELPERFAALRSPERGDGEGKVLLVP